jgi:DNA (cytosine-5)-methyltransferase 1
MRYGSVCSGIEAASVAWHPLGWEAAWLAEIEPFPSSLLQHHYPSVPNYGDMTALADRVSNLEIEAPDVLVGGTPCQAFSVAGLRQSLDDDRGQLTIKFLELANAIDTVRRSRGEPECIVVWENVPGVLSTKDNALGCFLAGLAGESEPLLPAGEKWSNAGCVFGPTRTVAWRVLDAQYFGVAQRRRRLFVIASARDDFNPAAVLFEFDGLRRDIAPSRTQRKDVAGPITAGIEKGCRGTEGIESNWAIPTYGIPGNWVGRKPENGGNAVQPMDDLSPNLTSTDRHAVASAVCFQQNTRDEVRLIGGEGNLAGALAASAGMKQTNYIAQPIPINSMNAFRSPDADKSTGCGIGEEGEAMFTLTKANHHAVAALGITLHGTDGTQSVASFTELSSSLRARTPSGVENSTTTAVLQSIAFEPGFLKREGSHFYHEHTGTLRRAPGDNLMAAAIGFTRCDHGGDAVLNGTPTMRCGSNYSAHLAAAIGWSEELTAHTDMQGTLQRSGDGGRHEGVIQPDMQVRRLTPTECERLQGFPDGYTLVPHRGKPAADGPRYKSLGNSMAVPVMAWIGTRINQAIQEGE